MKSDGRMKIKLLVSLQPGLHLRELQRQILISFSSTRYHVNSLATEGEIDGVEDNGYSRTYPAGTEHRDKILLSLIRRKTDHKIPSCLLSENSLSQHGLAVGTRQSQSPISDHQ